MLRVEFDNEVIRKTSRLPEFGPHWHQQISCSVRLPMLWRQHLRFNICDIIKYIQLISSIAVMLSNVGQSEIWLCYLLYSFLLEYSYSPTPNFKVFKNFKVWQKQISKPCGCGSCEQPTATSGKGVGPVLENEVSSPVLQEKKNIQSQQTNLQIFQSANCIKRSFGFRLHLPACLLSNSSNFPRCLVLDSIFIPLSASLSKHIPLSLEAN